MATRTLDAPKAEGIRTRGRDLAIRREDIRFESDASGNVLLEVTVRNGGDESSAPSVVRLEAAPLGVFVPWRAVREIALPSVPAGERLVLRARLVVDEPPSLGRPDRVSPARLLAAFDLHDGDDHWLDRIRARFSLPRARRPADLPADVLRAVSHGGFHWAGNLNVFLDDVPVERHLARALRVHPGQTNGALFLLGSGTDAYRFCFAGSATAWGPRLHDLLGARRLSDPDYAFPLPENEWIEMEGTRPIVLLFEPTTHPGEHELEVIVRQRSTGRAASVEFTLDRSAAGPGCYVLK